MKKLAVILRCHMRTYQYTAQSLINKILIPNNADLFIYTYTSTGISNCAIGNMNNINDFHIIKSSKGYFNEYHDGKIITEDDLNRIYNPYLKICNIINPNDIKFDVALPFNDNEHYKKLYSNYYMTSQAMKMFYKYCTDTNTKYDAVILSRPDLNYYNILDINTLDLDMYNIPNDTGLISLTSDNFHHYISSYRNVERSEYIPYKKIEYTDQFIVSSFENMKPLQFIYENINEFYKRGFPIQDPEGVFYYITSYLNNKKVNILNDFQHEIIRTDFINSLNQFSKENYKTEESKPIVTFWNLKIFKIPIIKIEKSPNKIRIRLFGISIIKITKN